MKALVKQIAKKALFRLTPNLVNQLELNHYIQNWVMPKDLETKNTSTFVPTDFFGHDGIEMHTSKQLERLKKWKDSYAGIFKRLREDTKINTQRPGKNYLHNGTYPTPDAEIYAAMILDYQPLNIIEIGAGFSTIIARKAVNELNNGCKITIIDPEPRTDIKDFVDYILYKCVEDVEISKIPLNEKALIFIDSSHVTRSRGDIPYLYNKILPDLPSGTLVHIHDIFIPYDYPFLYQKKLYTEQYILHALLSHSNKYRVVFSTHYMTRQYPDIMQEVFSDVVGKDDLHYGASFWFEVE